MIALKRMEGTMLSSPIFKECACERIIDMQRCNWEQTLEASR
jgi:hypothetical protein